MKKCLLSLLLLFALACDKEVELPAWDLCMSIADIERYAAAQGSVTESELTATMLSSVFRTQRHIEQVNGVWKWPSFDEPEFGCSPGKLYYLFDAEGRCELCEVHVFHRSVLTLGWHYDAGRKTIVLHATGDATDVVAEMEVLYFAADRLIVRTIYHKQILFNVTNKEERCVDQAYYVGDFSSLTREEFLSNFHNDRWFEHIVL